MEENKKSSAKIVGLVLGLFVNLLGLLGLLIYKDEDDRKAFIKGWLTGFIVQIVVSVIIGIVAISIGAKAVSDTLDFANQQMQQFPSMMLKF